MPTDAKTFRNISGPKAIVLASAIDGTNSAHKLCVSGFSYPNAIAISKMMTAGVGDVGALHRMGFSASDATTIAAAITAAGAH